MRIAIVNDVPLAVEALRRVVTSVPAYQVAWIAGDGEEAVSRCAADVPDLILMDLMMPRMDGAEATRLIMQRSPCAILVVTATVEGHAGKVFEAMGWGALDAVDTPVLGLSGDTSGAQPLLAKIAMLSRLIDRSASKAASAAPPAGRASGAASCPLVAIGASTGGPAALAQVIGGLPQELDAAVVVVQHVDQQFAAGLAAWLASRTSRGVATAAPGDRPAARHVAIASTNDHLVLAKTLEYRYVSEPADYPYRPSVDVFFRSALQAWPGPIVGVLLTGMGADGAEGLLELRRAGCHTIAQDRETCVVYGMPKAAAAMGAAVDVLPLDEIAPAIVRAVHTASARRQKIRA